MSKVSSTPIPERTLRRDISRVIRDVNGWISRFLERSGVSASIDVNEHGWFILKSEGLNLVLAILDKVFYYPMSSSSKFEKACKVHSVNKEIVLIHPDPDGGTLEFRVPVGRFMEGIRVKKGVEISEFIRAFCLLEGLPVMLNVQDVSVSDRTVKLYKEFHRDGLDCVLLLDATPMEVETLMEAKPVGDNVVDVRPLTPLCYMLRVRLGVEPSSIAATVKDVMRRVSSSLRVAILRWEQLSLLVEA